MKRSNSILDALLWKAWKKNNPTYFCQQTPFTTNKKEYVKNNRNRSQLHVCDIVLNYGEKPEALFFFFFLFGAEKQKEESGRGKRSTNKRKSMFQNFNFIFWSHIFGYESTILSCDRL